MFKNIYISIIILACLCAAAHAKARPSVKTQTEMLNYYYALMEYYSGYCDKIGAKELEETDILMFAGKYVLNEKDELKKQAGLKAIDAKLQIILQSIQKGTHEYRLFLSAQLGDYAQDGFQFDVINKDSCLDLTPLYDSGNGEEARSIIERGLLFGKVNRIKLFFVNAEEFKFLSYPADKKDSFLKSRTDPEGKVNKEVYAVILIEILPRDENKRLYEDIKMNIFIPGMENNYFMIARVKNIAVYGDLDMKSKIGSMGNFDLSGQTIKIR